MHTNDAKEEVVRRILELRVEHRDLDDAINALSQADYVDQLQLKRLKKRKLNIKDTILRLESGLIPDVDA
ncbi:MAG: YdcH family protein [Gammaproteobacteria bacterium]